MVGLAASVLAVAPASANSPTHWLQAGNVGLAVPAGWRQTHGLADCIAPREVVALARSKQELRVGDASRYRGGLLLVLEVGYSRVPFAPRTQFALRHKPITLEGCCDTPTSPAYEFDFRDHGRDFQAFVFAKGRAAAEGVAILNTLRVS